MRTFLATTATAPTAPQARNAAFALPGIPEVLSGLVLPAVPVTAEEFAAKRAAAVRRTAKTAQTSALHVCLCSQFTAENGDNTGVCDATTARKFAPGHDAKLKAMLVRAEVAGVQVAQGTVLRSGVETAALFGFAELVAKGAAAKLAKIATKNATKVAFTS